ncbi:hypothetical protein N9Z79_06950 [Akkermansiaceae bacterium]|nr:hypothetical protein [Akkermansiaceae bacterium]MDB4541917.1 hypothetical protein [bacterium]
MIYLKKFNDDVISHCSCDDGRIAIPQQLDCPWCGCGWLFSCLTCRKAFTFAEGIEIKNQSWEDLAREERRHHGSPDPDEETLAMWIDAMKELLRDVEVGQKYVIIDWEIIPTFALDVSFDGLYGRHSFKKAPQVEAIKNPSVIDRDLANQAYWRSHALSSFDDVESS